MHTCRSCDDDISHWSSVLISFVMSPLQIYLEVWNLWFLIYSCWINTRMRGFSDITVNHGVKPECFLIVSLSWSLGAFPMLVWLLTLGDAGGRLPWNKEWERLLFSSPSFLLVTVGWHSPYGTRWWLAHRKVLCKKLEMFPGIGAEGYEGRHTAPTCLEHCAPKLRRGSRVIVLFQGSSGALCPCVSRHRDRKNILSAWSVKGATLILKWIRMG